MKQLLITIAALVLVACGPSITIHKAAYEGNISAVKQHLAAGTDVNAKNISGQTPLHRSWTKEVTELLIAKGADVNVKDNKGSTPLHYAETKGSAELIIARGADINAKNERDETPLDIAKKLNRRHLFGVVDLLLKHGGKTGEELKAEGK